MPCLRRPWTITSVWQSKKMAGEPEKLLGEFFQLMLLAAFNEVAISTAFVECLSAQSKQWLLRSPKTPSVSLLAGKHMQSIFKISCGSKRARHATGNNGEVGEAAGHRQRTKRRRPEWVFRRGERGCKTSHHVLGWPAGEETRTWSLVEESFC